MTAPSTIGQRVQRLRLAADMNQADLARAAGIASGSISMIENGRQSASDDEIERLAAQLRCQPHYLQWAERPLLATQPWLRAYADASKKAMDRCVADTITAMEAFDVIGLKYMPDRLPTFDGDTSDDDDIEAYAQDVRIAANLEPGAVVGNAMRAVERLGVVILPMDDELGRHLGLSMWVNGRPVMRVSRPRIDLEGNPQPPGDRQRFTVLHELGHIGLHADQPPPASAEDARRIEKQAHRFAGAFLLPPQPVTDDLASLGGRVTLSTLTELKRRWGVSIKALVMRMQQMGVIDADQARSLYKQISARGMNKVEPAPVGNEDAIWLGKMLAKGIGRTPTTPHNGWKQAAAYTGLGVEFFERWTDWSAAASPRAADVIDLVPRKKGGSHRPGAASVTRMPSRS